MSDFDKDIARGCLENGEPLDALYGVGPWSDFMQSEPEPEPTLGQCPVCGGNSWYIMGEFIECENGCDLQDQRMYGVE